MVGQTLTGLPKGGLGKLPTPKNTWDTTGYGQQAGGMHPTGMHSCFNIKSGYVHLNMNLI